MKGILSTVLALALLATGAQAGIVTGGDFESGGPSGFSAFGNTGIVGDVGAPGPSVKPGGDLYFVQSSTGGSSGSIAAGSGPAAFFTGDPTGQGFDIVEYSGFSFSLTVTVPSIFGAQLNFQTSEYAGGAPDLVAVYADDGSGAVLARAWVVEPYSSVSPPVYGLPISDFDGTGITDATFGTFNQGQTGWNFETGFIAPGSYTMWFLVADVGDGAADTGFSVDNLSLAPVPEPGTWVLFGAGALGLVVVRRHRRKRT